MESVQPARMADRAFALLSSVFSLLLDALAAMPALARQVFGNGAVAET